MVMIQDKESLGEYADEGYYLQEYDDHVVTVRFKEQELAAFNQSQATKEALRMVCFRHKNRTNGDLTPKQCRDCTHWHWTGEWRGNCLIHRWARDKSCQDPTAVGCKEYAVRCAEDMVSQHG